MRRAKVTKFQVVTVWIRRDGLHMSAVKPLFPDLRAAMEKLQELERTTEPFYHYQIRGLRDGEPESLDGFKPSGLKYRGPVKLYAVKAGAYPPGKEPEDEPARWSYQWAHSAAEAKAAFSDKARFHGARYIRDVVELTLDQEREFLAAASASQKLRLLARYGEQGSHAVK